MALHKGAILVSLATIAEMYEVLSRKQFRRYFSDEDIRMFGAVITKTAEWIEVGGEIKECRDPKDNKFLEVAVSGGASHLVTGDSDLLALHPFRGVQIIAPQKFLESES